MGNRFSKILRTNGTLFTLCLLAFVIIDLHFSLTLAIIEAIILILFVVLMRYRNKAGQKSMRQYMDKLTGGLNTARSSNMLHAPLPMMVFDMETDEIVWANDVFVQLTEEKENIFDKRVDQVLGEFNVHWLLEGKEEDPDRFEWNGRLYRVFGSLSHPDDRESKGTMATTYWMDITELENLREEKILTKPVIAILMVDNYEDLMKNCLESKRSAVLAALEEKMNSWSAETGGLLLGYDRDRYLFLMEEQNYMAYVEEKFSILDTVRGVTVGNGVSATLSIGVGREGDTYDTLFKSAMTALEMALSRGGDQAVVKVENNFEFFGGRSKITEKRTKVKSRVMANALGELIDGAKQIYVMGHKYGDMDSLGSAAGICAIARKRGKHAQIVIDTENNSAHPLLRSLSALPEYKNTFISGNEAFMRVQSGALLIVVDTNRPASVESEQLLETCNSVAVIDHHRRGNSYIEKMALNYHEPYASSASELVTEVLQYLIEPTDLLHAEAEALLAGLVLDTKNFTNRTGSRTFEAAAYLRSAGADTQDVQRMFQSDLNDMINRYRIIRQAEVYRDDIAIVCSEEELERVTAAKAADELLTLQGVDASFVFYKKDDGVYISARSLGEINVQVIVETLGGGGNSTSAGGFLAGMNVEEANEKLRAAIDHYLEK